MKQRRKAAPVRALVKAGADIVWAVHAEPWKKMPGADDLAALPHVTRLATDVTERRNMASLAGRVGGQVHQYKQ